MTPRPAIISERPVRFALVGCGRVAPRHVEAIERLSGDGELVAVCDIDPTALRQFEGEPVRRYTDLEALLQDDEVDVVSLATPSGLHPAQTIEAARAGKHVVTEKPMATRWLDAPRMVEACRDAGVRLFVVKQHRYNRAVGALEQALAEDRLGRVYSVQLNLFWTRPQDYYDLAAWRGTWELDGGALMNQAIHYIDLMQWLIGPVESVQAFTGTLARRIEVEDTAVVNLRWRNGALGTANITMLTPEQNFEGSLTVIGERGIVRLGGLACSSVQTWHFDEPHPADDDIREHEAACGDVYGNGHVPFYRDVVRALRGEDAAAVVDGAEALKSLEIVIAAYQSAREGRRIPLPLEL